MSQAASACRDRPGREEKQGQKDAALLASIEKNKQIRFVEASSRKG